jgi:hypothetical protein
MDRQPRENISLFATEEGDAQVRAPGGASGYMAACVCVSCRTSSGVLGGSGPRVSGPSWIENVSLCSSRGERQGAVEVLKVLVKLQQSATCTEDWQAPDREALIKEFEERRATARHPKPRRRRAALDHGALNRLQAAIAFASLEPWHPDLRLLHQWLASWRGLGAIVDGTRRQDYDVQMKLYPGGWRVNFWRPDGDQVIGKAGIRAVAGGAGGGMGGAGKRGVS